MTARWSVAPDPPRVHADDLPGLAAGYARLSTAALASSSFAELDGSGPDTVGADRVAQLHDGRLTAG